MRNGVALLLSGFNSKRTCIEMSKYTHSRDQNENLNDGARVPGSLHLRLTFPIRSYKMILDHVD